MKIEFLESKIRGKIEFLGGEKERGAGERNLSKNKSSKVHVVKHGTPSRR
jgi:hypothetical protein